MCAQNLNTHKDKLANTLNRLIHESKLSVLDCITHGTFHYAEIQVCRIYSINNIFSEIHCNGNILSVL